MAGGAGSGSGGGAAVPVRGGGSRGVGIGIGIGIGVGIGIGIGMNEAEGLRQRRALRPQVITEDSVAQEAKEGRWVPRAVTPRLQGQHWARARPALPGEPREGTAPPARRGRAQERRVGLGVPGEEREGPGARPGAGQRPLRACGARPRFPGSAGAGPRGCQPGVPAVLLLLLERGWRWGGINWDSAYSPILTICRNSL